MTERAAVVTILFTDLVGSTELLARAGDEEAQRIFRAHHTLLAETAAGHGGEEVKWLGDGLMVAFASALDALRAAIAMQQASRRPVSGERLSIRVGLNAGEALRDAADYFGTSVVVARRLCDRADGGQILCTETVAGLLAGRSGFTFSELGKILLKGVPDPVAACEVRYEAPDSQAQGLAAQVPMVGRDTELARLVARVAEGATGHGGLVLVSGEPGMGKSRMVEEVAERARGQGMTVLSGRAFESDWAPPYALFAEALAEQIDEADPQALLEDLGPSAAPLAQLLPGIRHILPGVPEPAAVQPDEERFRLIDAAAQFLVARSRRTSVLLILDDLHWADRGSVAMLRHVARTATRHRLLIVGTYREAELEQSHPLSEAFGALRRETELEDVRLRGLDAKATAALLSALGGHEMSEAASEEWRVATDGNPLFLRELLRYFVEEGKVSRDAAGRWTTDRPIKELGIPPSVRDVLVSRLARLSEPARKLIGVGCAFEGPVIFNVVSDVAGLTEDEALDALDEAVRAQVVRYAGGGDAFAFTHALTRSAVYAELSPPRQVRLHRRLAEALEAAYGERAAPAHAGEIAAQYHRSASLPGAERGVDPALLAAAHAEATAAHETAAGFLRMALDLLPTGDDRRPRLLGRLGMALTWSLAFEEAAPVAVEAAEAIAATEGNDDAVEYLAEAAYVCALAGSPSHAWALAAKGLARGQTRRGVAWARLLSLDAEREAAEDPDFPGIPRDKPERGEAAAILRAAHLDPMGPGPMEAVCATRDEILTSTNLPVLFYWAGEYASSITRLEPELELSLTRGQFARAARCCCLRSMSLTALGRIDDARRSLEDAKTLADRVGRPIFNVLQAQEGLAFALEGLEELLAAFTPLASTVIPALAWGLGFIYGTCALAAARLSEEQVALKYLALLVPWLERAPAWHVGFPVFASDAAETIWRLERLEHAAVVEYAVREKVIQPDFRTPMADGRLALARVCALQGRHDEAQKWLGESRRVLEEQRALPLLAIADFDEALMFVRRGGPRDEERAVPLLDAARRQFIELGMTGWQRRADELRARLA
ncbi:MAG TPA: AAA family ATPase [Acidimicrobiia bacterium]|nr:AAA family ATPase [Acidimicrobiia bacterium]